MVDQQADERERVGDRQRGVDGAVRAHREGDEVGRDEQIAGGRSVLLAMGARTASMLMPAALMPAEVEIAVATDDGSAGPTGFVSALFEEHLPWCDQAFACGPAAMFAALAASRRRATSLGGRKPVQVLMEERMACGYGACYSCAARPRRGGVRLVCKDGPRFDLLEIF